MEVSYSPTPIVKLNRQSKSEIITLFPKVIEQYSDLQSCRSLKAPIKQNLKVEVSGTKKRKNFLEMMGYKRNPETHKDLIPMNIEASPHLFSSTDLMGSKRYDFLKQSGFLPIYNEYKRVEEVKKLIDQKFSLTHSSILRLDLIRSTFKVEKKQATTPKNIKPVSFNRNQKIKRIEEIEKILHSCNQFNCIKKNKVIEKIEMSRKNQKPCEFKFKGRKPERRITNHIFN